MLLRHVLTVATLALAGWSAAAWGAGDPAKGAELATTCMGCHGIPGYRNAYPSYRVPKLGGPNADYLVLALQGYRANSRQHPTMQAQAASLSDEDMQHIAAFLAEQGAAQPGNAVTSGNAARGKEKAAVCAACHGEAGISTAPNWPNLAGQHRDYLVHSITAYRDTARQDPVMQGQVAALSDEDIRDLAAYYSAQRGLFTSHYKQ